MPDLTGTTLGRYTILERVGRGGMADVYRAHQPSLDRDVAIKVLNPFLLNDSANSDRFRREAKAVATLHHSNIVQVLDYDSEGETFYMVMAFIEGSTLKAVLDDHAAHGTRLSLGEIGAIMTAIGSALSYAHSRGMIHRDIKPHNIMFTAEGTPMLTDFGIARMVHGSTASVSGGLSGTPAYMSPEQGKGEPLDARSDIYSLGVVLYEMLTSRVPFDADTPFAVVIKHMNDPLPPPRSINGAIPEPLERVVLRALAKSPAERYQTVDEMVQATQAAIAAAQHAGATTIPAMPVPVPTMPAVPVPARVTAPAPVPIGAALLVCPKCGGNNPAGSRYCDQCSAPLDGTVPPRNRTIPPSSTLSTAPTWVAQPPPPAPPPPVAPLAQMPAPTPAIVAPVAVSVPVTPALVAPVLSPSVPPPPPVARPARSGGLSPALLVGALLAIGVFLGAGLIALLTSGKTPAPGDDPAAKATSAAISVQSTQLVVQQFTLQTTMTAAAGLSGAAQETAVGAATAQAQSAAGTTTALSGIAADSAATAQARVTGTALAGIANAAGQATAAANVTAVAAVTEQAAATAQAVAQAQAVVQAQAGTATAQAQAVAQAQAAQTQTGTAGQAQGVAQAQTASAGQAAQATAAARTAGQAVTGKTATAQAANAVRQQAATREAQRTSKQTATAQAQVAQAAQAAQTAAAAQAQAAIGRQVAAQTATAQAQAAAQALAAAQAAQTVAAQAATAQAQAQTGQAQAQIATAQARVAATGTAIALAQAAAIDTRVARGYATATARAAQAAAPTAAPAGCSAGGSRSGSAAPSTVRVGQVIQFTATGFNGGESVSYWFTSPNGEVTGTAAPVPGGVRDDGSVNFKPVRVPDDFAQNPGRWAITVQGAGSGHQAVIFFCVVQ